MSLQLQPQPKPLDWPSVLEHLREVLPRWQHRHQSPILQLCIPIAEPDPLEWLQHQEGATRVCWSDREHQFQLVGLGSALQIRGTTDEVMQKDKPQRCITFSQRLLQCPKKNNQFEIWSIMTTRPKRHWTLNVISLFQKMTNIFCSKQILTPPFQGRN